MTARETMSVKQVPQAPRHRQQVRNFALIWTGITLLLGACTFISVYAATGLAANNRNLAPAAIGLNVTTTNADASGTDAVTDATSVPVVANATTPTPQTEAPTLAKAAVAQQSTTEPTKAPTKAPEPTTAPPTATLSAVLDTDFDLGIAVQKNADPNIYKIWVKDVVQDLKLNWVKSQVVWRDTEKVKGQIDWGELDVAMAELSKSNVKVMLSITKAPDWARDPGAPTNQQGVLDGPPQNPQDFADFLTTILKRYPNQVHAVEVWNEINLDREWSTAPQQLDASRYVKLLKAAHDAIKAIDPNILVISAALAPTGANIPGKVSDDFLYMDKLIGAGMLDFADCVGAHHNGINVPPTADYNNIPPRAKPVVYRGPWDNPHHSWAFKSTLEGYNKSITKAGRNTKLCVTEFGWPSAEGLEGKPSQNFQFALDNSLQDQADFTDQAITMMEQWGFVRLAFVWNLNYGPQAGWDLGGPSGDNVLYSIIAKDWSGRPVWNKIADRNFRAKARQATQPTP